MLTGENWEIDVCAEECAFTPLFGQALESRTGNDQHIPIKVRGVCRFELKDKEQNILNSGTILFHDKEAGTVYVLL